MQDDVEYATEMFWVIEGCVKDYKDMGMDYFESFERLLQVAAPRQSEFGMPDSVAEYDMRNIMATFNIIWGE